LKQIRAKHNIVIAGGQGKELSGKVIRIATMGAVGADEIRTGLAALKKVLAEMQNKPVHPEQAVHPSTSLPRGNSRGGRANCSPHRTD
jgi:aspartate aminotransferase-like enzyme